MLIFAVYQYNILTTISIINWQQTYYLLGTLHVLKLQYPMSSQLLWNVANIQIYFNIYDNKQITLDLTIFVRWSLTPQQFISLTTKFQFDLQIYIFWMKRIIKPVVKFFFPLLSEKK